MYKLMIVDDEFKTRQTLYRYVPWLNMGITSVEQAEDGKQALQKSIAFAPDILLTDVRMPHMNGIELAKELRTLLPRCKIIFLSAYSDVEYLKNAIKLQAFDYIEKPLDLEEIECVIKSVVSACSEDQQQWEMEKKLQEQEDEQLMVRKQHLALSLCGIGEKREPGTMTVDLDHKDIRFPLTGTFVSIAFQYRAAECFSGELSYRPTPELHQLECQLSDLGFCCLTGPIKHGHWVMQVRMPSPLAIPSLRQAAQGYIEDCRNKLTDVFVAIGGAVDDLFSLPSSYKQASSLSKRSFYLGYSQVLVFENDSSPVYSFDPLLTEQWFHHLRKDQFKEAENQIRQFVSELRLCPDTPVEQIKNVFYSLFHQLRQWNQKSAGLSVRVSAQRLSDADLMDSLSTLDEYEEFLLRELQSVSYEERGKTGSIVSRIAHIIREQAGNQNLTINSIAGQLFLTPSYICLLFKNETGMTVNQYLTSVRMEMAKALIAQHKIHEVAKRVGYTDTKYFTKIFKKEVGWTPSEYRERLRP
ncbi:response regulator transcription factor [Cohnella silvisoli]|uniref:Response regulator n=1 Tax=Cohnella silvisoli TaxID=2873699 RepID=A0ABV1L3J3_9BACL|nr:response regulator [Cohnella silvisoli]MCD9026197.1 response regulator [Cohnella silvisoli]